jgi:hypothetical protein
MKYFRQSVPKFKVSFAASEIEMGRAQARDQARVFRLFIYLARALS